MRILIAALGCWSLGLGLSACGSAATVSSPAAIAPSTAAPPTSFTLVATGDFISQPELSTLADAEGGFARILGALEPMTSTADVAICHMETPFAGPGDPWTGYPIFNAPPVLADTTATIGYDSCSTASNHTVDYGWDGLVRTLDGLDRVGVKHAGSARSADEAATPTILDVHGIKVAHLSYTFSFNGLSLPDDKPWASNLIDVPAILNEAHRARAAGASVVVLSMHWGTEYMNEADFGQTGLASELLASDDIDLILGTHVHVVQPLEKLGTKWVAYGMGNVMVRFPDGSPENTQDAYATRYTFSLIDGRWQVSKVEVAPMWMEYDPVPRVVDLTAELASGNQRDDYQRAYDRIIQWAGAMGAPLEFVGAAGAKTHHKHGS
jgi:poly-gamma-glutamate synthesis protein (capsule biosynthesis protein)